MDSKYLQELISDEAQTFLKGKHIFPEIEFLLEKTLTPEIKSNLQNHSLMNEFSKHLEKDTELISEYETRFNEILLHIDITQEFGKLEPMYVFSSHENWNNGYIAYVSEGLEKELNYKL